MTHAAMFPNAPEPRWTSYSEFYQKSEYAQFPQEHRSSRGRLHFRMFLVQQGPHNFCDPALPETVIALPLSVESQCNWNWWIGDKIIRRKSEAGRMLVVPSDCDSRWEVDGRRNLLVLIIPNATIRRALGPSCPSQLTSAFWKLSQDTWADALIEMLMTRLWDVTSGTNPADRYLADGLLMSIVGQLLIQAETLLGTERTVALPQWRFNRVSEFVDNNLENSVALDDLAKAAGLSRRHFARSFQIQLGETPHRWLMQRRIDRAKEMLATTDSSLSDIAAACGFSSQGHLTTLMRKNLGLTASAWRRKFRE